MSKKWYFTSESVTEGHPDKLCDYISDTILDEALKQDKYSRVAIETFASANQITIAGQLTTNATLDIEKIVRDRIKEIGYDRADLDIDYRTCKVLLNISKQSPDIAIGVDKSLEDKLNENIKSEGAGDQGMMFGYATDETKDFMPMPIYLAHKLAKRLTEVRKKGIVKNLRPDGKVQVTVKYENEIPKRIDTIVISTQHEENTNLEELKKEIKEKVIKEIVPSELLNDDTKYFINPTGRFVIGGPLGDSGLTGRKIIVDTYGGMARHGGGAFSGKDYTKVDRSASYYARYVCKNIVASKICSKMELQVSYAIGMSKPVSIYINTYNTNKIPEDKILEIINKNEIKADVICYVPMTKSAIKNRGFNQCKFIAYKIGYLLDIPISNCILKIKHTKEKKTLSKDERRINVEGAFKIKDNRDIFNKVVILIDDVMTTGSTINECKKILKNNGAKRIIVLTIAKSDI